MMRKGTTTRRSNASNRVSLRWIVLSFLFVNLVVLVYVFSYATHCNETTTERNHPDPHGPLQVVESTTRSSSTTTTKQKSSVVHPFRQWLRDNAHTPGAKFVSLLHQHIHYRYGAEGERLQGCHDKNYPLCFAGHQSYQQALQKAPTDKRDSLVYLERTTHLPLLPEEENLSVWQIRRYGKTLNKKLRMIHNLGTEPSCLALLLAGASVQNGVMVELGTYAGLSSRCLAFGLNASVAAATAHHQKPEPESYHAFDVFGHDQSNFDKISRNMPWIYQIQPDFGVNSSYQWMWRMAIHDVYPTAVAHEGFINATTLYPRLWHKRPIDVLSVDSAKSWSAFRDQTAGIQRPYMLKKGALLILMDFVTIDTQIKLLYTGCLRQYLQPVYSAYCRGEQWIFVATQSFSLGMVGACMEDYLGDDDTKAEPEGYQYHEMLEQAKADVDFMDGLFFQRNHDNMKEERKCLLDKLRKELYESKAHWKYLKVQ